jgi:NADH:ubiquinone oxidoreductase subunit 5 (subunit L)/multisubunit Na+/H+ antiporter MnhA subunit
MGHLPTIYAAAVLLPLASFAIILIFAQQLGRFASWIATLAILGACLLSFLSLGLWLNRHFPEPVHHGGHAAGHEGDEAPAHSHGRESGARIQGPGARSQGSGVGSRASEGELPLRMVALVQESAAAKAEEPKAGHEPLRTAPVKEPDAAHGERVFVPHPVYTGEYYTLGEFGPLRVTISYYIDALTVLMFCMVTFIATCIHFYAGGYMHDELDDVTDKEVVLADGSVLHRPGRYPRFFQYLSLFCFSMLGLVLAGNIAMVFVFWELVGICSYFLIGFYIERKTASNAANKAFIVNRVGDFGMIIGLMVLWSTLGTFAFGDIARANANGEKITEPGIFSLVRPGEDHALIVPDGMVQADAKEQTGTRNGKPVLASAVGQIMLDHASSAAGLDSAQSEVAARTPAWREKGYGYWLLVLAGLGIFCGCVGKSAQFPLHVWLPDAMEGPTPVSALVHSATMVAAGVYLVGRFVPVFAPEVLLVIAIIGTITMLLGASIAFAANDIKRVLAYSTVSQLGLMMVALGIGGWLAGLLHLITHAFFKSMLFMCSGSVIHAVHTNDMRRMGGLWRKMPVTAITMLIGCLAIAGVSVPFVVGFSGYYSKDAILEQLLAFWRVNQSPQAGLFFILTVAGAAMTTCYMFRMWFLTFVGQPRDNHAYDHAHESPPVMILPLVVLAVLATCVAWNYQYLGYFAIAAAFFVGRAWQQGWFQHLQPTAAHDHGHDTSHGHNAGHAHEDLEHETAAHYPAKLPAETGHIFPAHPPGEHTHVLHTDPGVPAVPPLTWGWTALMLACTILGGWFIQQRIGETWHDGLSLQALLEQARPLGTLSDAAGAWTKWTWPSEHYAHDTANFATIVVPATLLASGSWVAGILLAAAFFWQRALNPDDVRRQFAPVYNLLVNKWWFDELYDAIFVQPTMVISRLISAFDKRWIDGFLDRLALGCIWFSRLWDLVADRTLVDGFVNLLAGWTYSLGVSLHAIQTGKIRQYVMFIVIGAVAIFVLISFFWSPTLAR